MINILIKRICLFAALLSAVFVGLYLRHYFVLEGHIDMTPYELIVSNDFDGTTSDDVVNFSDKASRYNLSYLVNNIFPGTTQNFYWIFIFLGGAIFYLAYLLTDSYLGALVAFSVFSISGENLIYYTRTIGASGLSYFLLVCLLISIYKFISSGKNKFAFLLLGVLILNIFTYHNGASAGIVLFGSVLASLVLELIVSKIKKRISIVDGGDVLKLGVLFLFGLFIYLNHVSLNDIHQISQIFYLLSSVWPFVLILISALTLFLLVKFSFFYESHFTIIQIIGIIVSLFLLFSPVYLFDVFQFIPIWNYYISPVSLNNYFVQIILLHLILFVFVREIIVPKDKKNVILRGWLISLVLIFSAFFLKGYYARFMDYSVPLISILFGIHITKNLKNKLLIGVYFITLLIIFYSQILIFQDDFSLRRYYKVNEFTAAQEISEYLSDENYVFSDLRTAAVFSAVGQKNVMYTVEDDLLHDIFFFHPYYIDETHLEYFIISDYMKKILYSANFPSTPLNDEDFEFYENNFKLIDYVAPFYLYNIKHE